MMGAEFVTMERPWELGLDDSYGELEYALQYVFFSSFL